MATPKDFIGISALQEVANQVFASVVQGPAFANPEEMKRLGIKTISGVQYKRTINVFIRKGGTTRRKDMNPTMNGTIGFLKERVLTAKLAWFKGTDNIDRYCETVLGVDAQGAYPLSTVAVEAVIKTHADDLYNNLWWGDIDNDVEGASDEKKAMGLYDGFITCIKHDIEDGIISEANHNLIHCEAITAPTSATDSSAYKNFREAYMSLDPRLRRQNVYAYMTPETAINTPEVKNRGYVDVFLIDYIHFILNRKRYYIKCLASVAQVADIQNHWKEWWNIDGKKCLIDKVNAEVSAKDGLGEVELEVFAI